MVLFEKAPAKINLSLDVLRKRDDGYHDVEMIMTTIDLSDRIEFHSLETDEIRVSLESRFVPNDERNLAYRASRILKDRCNIKQGVYIKMEKSIPVSAGLGGGSSDAAAVLRGLNRLWSLDLPLEELALIGLAVGSDVPFCVMNTTALVTGRGEVIEKLPPPPQCWVVLAKPDIGVSTKTIFNQIVVENLNHVNTNEIVNALKNQDLNRLRHNMQNVLEPITFNMHPEVRHIKEKMTEAGACNVMMSGSGPTLFSLVEHETKAQRIYNGLRGFCKEVYKVRLLG